jgi:hypothetical protein
MGSVMATEFKGRDEAIQSMKGVVMAAKTEKKEAEARKEALKVIQQNVECPEGPWQIQEEGERDEIKTRGQHFREIEKKKG